MICVDCMDQVLSLIINSAFKVCSLTFFVLARDRGDKTKQAAPSPLYQLTENKKEGHSPKQTSPTEREESSIVSLNDIVSDELLRLQKYFGRAQTLEAAVGHAS
eukprot:scaffold85134_cov51-Attheya_sp.AAC.5